MLATIAGAIRIHHGPQRRFDHNRSVPDIDTSIAGEPKPVGHRYKSVPIAIETNRWRRTS
jgi:hypothetical protein